MSELSRLNGNEAARRQDSAAGGDGNLYFVEANAGRPARVTTAGEVTELGIPDVDSFPLYITLGPDGAMWFTEQDSNRLGRIAPDGRITKFELPEITRVDVFTKRGLQNVDSIPTGVVGRGDRLFVGLLGQELIAFTDLAAAEPTRTATRTPTTGIGEPTATATEETPEATETATASCAGDCDGDQAGSIAELISAVNIALGKRHVGDCPTVDPDGDGVVRVNELVTAVSRALRGC